MTTLQLSVKNTHLSNMEKITINLDRYKKEKKAPSYFWQELALEAIEYLEEPKKSVVFKWFRNREQQATAVLRYMKDKKKRHFLYMAKMMNL